MTRKQLKRHGGLVVMSHGGLRHGGLNGLGERNQKHLQQRVLLKSRCTTRL